MKITGSSFCNGLFGIAVWIALLPVAMADDSVVPIRLPHGVQIELPSTWEVLNGNQRTTLDSTAHSNLARAGVVFDASSDLNFAANYYDETKKTAALLNIRYHPDSDLTQSDTRAASAADILELDTAVRQRMVKVLQTSGASLLAWNGTSRKVLNGVTVLVTEYKRSSPTQNANFKVRLVQVNNGGETFDLTISYRERNEDQLRPICDRIISSLRIDPTPLN